MVVRYWQSNSNRLFFADQVDTTMLFSLPVNWVRLYTATSAFLPVCPILHLNPRYCNLGRAFIFQRLPDITNRLWFEKSVRQKNHRLIPLCPMLQGGLVGRVWGYCMKYTTQSKMIAEENCLDFHSWVNFYFTGTYTIHHIQGNIQSSSKGTAIGGSDY